MKGIVSCCISSYSPFYGQTVSFFPLHLIHEMSVGSVGGGEGGFIQRPN